jgi:acetylornithine deacetylase
MDILERLVNEAVELTKRLISIPSTSGNEILAIECLKAHFAENLWPVELIEVSEKRANIFVSFGVPEIVFTTHVDVVPGKAELFYPKEIEGGIFGRGACDAKGIVATMIASAKLLREAGASNFGLLFVVGEEDDGIGAKVAGEVLKNRGIKFLVNGEPTKNKLVSATKGAVRFSVKFQGKSAHSGYPELGVDANAKLLKFLYKLQEIDFGSDDVLGSATLNIGYIQAGLDAGVISDSAIAEFVIRTVSDNNFAIEKVQNIFQELKVTGELKILFNSSSTKLLTLSGFETEVVSFATDIPNFSKLNAQCLLYGPGDIAVAHSDNECLAISEIEKAIKDYSQIYQLLSEVHLHQTHQN